MRNSEALSSAGTICRAQRHAGLKPGSTKTGQHLKRPGGPTDFSPGREPWEIERQPLTPALSRWERGDRKAVGVGPVSHGLRHGLKSSAPGGADKRIVRGLIPKAAVFHPRFEAAGQATSFGFSFGQSPGGTIIQFKRPLTPPRCAATLSPGERVHHSLFQSPNPSLIHLLIDSLAH